VVRLTRIPFNEGHGIAGSDELATTVKPETRKPAA
jgi:hypothetical protein